MNIGACVTFLIRVLLFSRYMPGCGMSNVENLFMCLMAIYTSSLKKCLGLIAKIQKQLIQLNNNSNKNLTQSKNGQKTKTDFSKEDMCVCAHLCPTLCDPMDSWLEIPCTEKPDRLQYHTFTTSWTRQSTYVHTHAHMSSLEKCLFRSSHFLIGLFFVVVVELYELIAYFEN